MAEERVTKPEVVEELTVSPRRAALRARWAEFVLLAALAVYAVMAVLAYRYAYFDWDLNVARGIQSISLPGFKTLMIWVSALGSKWLPTALVGVVGIALMAVRFRLEGAVCIIGVAAGAALNAVLTLMSARPRPDATLINIVTVYRHNSFPSGHVVFFVEFFGFLLFLTYVLLKRGYARRALAAVLGLLVMLVGVSRVYLGAHWPSDVVGAYLAGGIWLTLMVEVYRRLKPQQKN
jgi:membrane-associated phospholipid phosphatase